MQTTSAADFAKWSDMAGLFRAFGLEWGLKNRADAVQYLVGSLAHEARKRNKKVGLDLFTPSIATAVGQDYNALSTLCDWIKPMSYCHAKGPAGIPLELASLARGLMAWSPNVPGKDIMEFVGRSFAIADLPGDPALLEQNGLDENFAGTEFALAKHSVSCPVYSGFECVKHPDFDLDMSENGVRRYLAALRDAPGVVLSWNILYSPESFLRLAGTFA